MGSPLSLSDFQLLIEGAILTLQLFICSLAISVCVGGLFGLVRSGRGTRVTLPIRAVLTFYSDFFRGIPLLVQMLFLFYGLRLMGLSLPEFVAALIALSAFGSACVAEIVRASLDAVPEGQWLAARSIGMSYFQALRHVVVPQAIRIAIPPTVGFAALSLKSTTLASIVGFLELVRAGSIIAIRTRAPLVAFSLVAGTYLLLVLPIMVLSNRLEGSLRRYAVQD